MVLLVKQAYFYRINHTRKRLQLIRAKWFISSVPAIRPERKISGLRVGLHLTYWSYNYLSVTDTYGQIFTPKGAEGPILKTYYTALIDNMAVTWIAYYLLGAFLLPSILNQLVYRRVSGKANGLFWFAVSVISVLGFAFLSINDYYLFSYLHTISPVSIRYVDTWYERFQVAGPLGTLKSFSMYQFVFAFNFYYILVPVLLKTIREAIGWGVVSYHQQVRNEQLKQNAENRLTQLNYQINPHFLFNTFNSLYGLIFKTNKTASQLLHRLTRLLSYTLYDANRRLVSLKGEIAFLDNFIGIEKFRRFDPDRIQFDQRGSPGDLQVPPLLLITFIENAFKHGLDTGDVQGWVTVHLHVDERQKRISLTVANSKRPTVTSLERTKGGMGLANAQERLNLIYGPQGYRLTKRESETHHWIELKIEGEALLYG